MLRGIGLALRSGSQGLLLRLLGVRVSVGDIGSAPGVPAIAHLRGGRIILDTEGGAFFRLLGPDLGGLALRLLLGGGGFLVLLGRVLVLDGDTLSLQALGLGALLLQLGLPRLLAGDTVGILDVKLFIEHTGQNHVLDDGEHALSDPVDTHDAGHGEADPQRDQRHGQLHALHLLIVRLGLGIGGVGDLHGEIAQRCGNDGDQEQADMRPVEGVPVPEGHVRRLRQVDAQEIVLQGHQLVRQGLEVGKMLGDELRLEDLGVDLLAVRQKVRAPAKLGQLRRNGAALLQKLGGHAHHGGQREADGAVQRDQDGERDQRPQAAGHGVHALFLVELVHLLLIALLVVAEFLFQLLEPGGHAGGAHHALLALELEGQHDELHHERKENDRDAVVACPVVQLQHQPAKGFCDHI